LNPAIYLISILPGIGVWLLNRPEGNAEISFFIATFAVVLAQHAINLLNDAADWRLGADVEKWNSWVRYHQEDTGVATRHGWVSFIFSGVLGLTALIWVDRLWILVIALPLVGLGYLYNSGQRPLSYTRLGEWVTAVCYGPGVFGCLWLMVGQEIGASVTLGSIAFGCLAAALLLSHQPSQIDTDYRAGKQSFAVRFGVNRTHQAVRILYFIFLVTWSFALAVSPPYPMALLLSVIVSCLVFTDFYRKVPEPKQLLLSASALLVILLLGLAL
jgi:1,4-dihydroxy-2-naphthoate octaprenyltransferase